jgi:hypothetical protein
MKAMGNYDFECILTWGVCFFFVSKLSLFFFMMEFVNDNFMLGGEVYGTPRPLVKNSHKHPKPIVFWPFEKKFPNILNQMSRPLVKDPQTL